MLLNIFVLAVLAWGCYLKGKVLFKGFLLGAFRTVLLTVVFAEVIHTIVPTHTVVDAMHFLPTHRVCVPILVLVLAGI
jgi:hypothetical protein